MIPTTELRIGNWVLDRDKRKVRIDTIKNVKGAYVVVFKEDCLKGGDYCGDLFPIPLTAKILEQCGFKKHHAEWYNNHLMVKTDRQIFEVWLYPNDNSLRSANYLTKVKYLHQLQNLYFALTGEELKITL